jgi:hypothetical protein
LKIANLVAVRFRMTAVQTSSKMYGRRLREPFEISQRIRHQEFLFAIYRVHVCPCSKQFKRTRGNQEMVGAIA